MNHFQVDFGFSKYIILQIKIVSYPQFSTLFYLNIDLLYPPCLLTFYFSLFTAIRHVSTG